LYGSTYSCGERKLYITGNNLPAAGLSDREVCKRHCQWQCLLCLVRLAAHVSNGLKSRIRPVVGRIKPKARVSIVRWNLKEAGCEEYTNSRANLWSDEQKSHMRSCMWVRQQAMLKPNNYTESCMINEADGWRGRNVWYLGRSVRYALKEVTIA
jgi:hypothetical protein